MARRFWANDGIFGNFLETKRFGIENKLKQNLLYFHLSSKQQQQTTTTKQQEPKFKSETK